PASATPASDGRNVYAFFGDFGLISFGPDGNERWRLPLGPFNNPFGASASPVLSGNTLLQSLDQETGSHFLAVDKDSGRILWKADRRQYTRGFSTPVLYEPASGPVQALLAGSYRLNAYDVRTGAVVWWVGGLTWQLKPTPVIDNENVYVVGWAGEADPGQQEIVPSFEDACARLDANRDGKLSKEETGDPKIVKQWHELDLDLDGFLGPRDWSFYQSKRTVVNSVQSIRLGGRGDVTASGPLWKYYKSLPNVPSPLLYEGVLYLMKEGGILTTLDAKTGAVLKQGRLTGAPGPYFSSPVGADGKVYVISEEGNVTVLKAGGEWEILAVNAMDDGCHATPAIAGGRLHVRTHSALYCFARQPAKDSK
ncbi:MAG: PQQ-binding-like beta-propeller repeat protein, partial [Bryobacteraceae bacterium]